ncbi:hypothetical protein CDD80_2346 [Ophiocordyceps camponoti-rufipedis]|uniref:Uncharacterized protein n=1 Tax=Ophiocordyceps camponoti-rufipedis TaxID=2004952 RepID=A0A2C5Z647_9HYPO|nr:hypothetical protein CDD80_2346 [Ophiocordyceps camponoti-rufipedis]
MTANNQQSQHQCNTRANPNLDPLSPSTPSQPIPDHSLTVHPPDTQFRKDNTRRAQRQQPTWQLPISETSPSVTAPSESIHPEAAASPHRETNSPLRQMRLHPAHRLANGS